MILKYQILKNDGNFQVYEIPIFHGFLMEIFTAGFTISIRPEASKISIGQCWML